MSQTWSAASYAKNGAFVPALGAAVVAWLAPARGERILDLGCGDGTLTATLLESGAVVTGIDAAPDFVAAARTKGIDARFCDARALPFVDAFDAVFSNAALHWMPEPERVAAAVARALVPNGRFVAEFGGAGNVATIFEAIHAELAAAEIDATARSPWFFPTAERYATILREAGFAVERIELFARPTPIGHDMAAWLETFAQPFFTGLAPDPRARLIERVVTRLEATPLYANGTWTADYVRLRFAARLGA